MLYKFLSAAVFAAFLSPVVTPLASAQTATGDAVIVEMNQAFKRGDRKKLSALLPQAKGHALEPYAAYWELKADRKSVV